MNKHIVRFNAHGVLCVHHGKSEHVIKSVRDLNDYARERGVTEFAVTDSLGWPREWTEDRAQLKLAKQVRAYFRRAWDAYERQLKREGKELDI